MIYIQLSSPIEGYKLVRIKECHFFDSDDNEKTPVSIGFRYQICNEFDGKYYELYNKYITIDNDKTKIFIEKDSKLSPYDEICRAMLEYLLKEKIVTGTLEIK